MRISKHHFRDIRVSVFVSSVSYLTAGSFCSHRPYPPSSSSSWVKLNWDGAIAACLSSVVKNLCSWSHSNSLNGIEYIYIYIQLCILYICIYIYTYVECIASSSLVASLLTYCDKLETSKYPTNSFCLGGHESHGWRCLPFLASTNLKSMRQLVYNMIIPNRNRKAEHISTHCSDIWLVTSPWYVRCCGLASLVSLLAICGTSCYVQKCLNNDHR